MHEAAYNLLEDGDVDPDDEYVLENKPSEALQPDRHDLLRTLIDRAVDVRKSDHNDWTLLHHAVWLDSIESIEILIQRGADVKAKTRMGNTVLHLAQSAEAVGVLVGRGADIDALNCKDETPLISACNNGLVYVVQELVNRWTNLTPQDHHQRTALHSACLGEYDDMVLSCLQKEAEVEVDDEDDEDEERETRLVEVYDEDGETPLHIACYTGNAEIVRFLIEAAADTEKKDSYGRAPLNRACYDGFEDIAKVLLESGCDVDTAGPGHRTALNVAARKGYVGIVKLLIERGANLDAPDNQALTPLHAAASCGDVEISEMLLDAGAEVMIIASDCSTPLHHSMEADAPELW